MKLRIFLIGVMFLCCGTLSAYEVKKDATLLKILVDSKKFDKEMVRIVGFLSIKNDENALYLHEEDYRHAIFANSIALEITDDMRNRVKQLNHRYVVLEGYFDAYDGGDMNVRTGTLKRIKYYQVWSTGENPVNLNAAPGQRKEFS